MSLFAQSGPGPVFVSCGKLILEKMDSEEETIKYWGYQNQKFKKVIFNDGESSCLAVALTKQYGLICDEKQVLEEFRSEKDFEAPSWTSKDVVELALKVKFLTKDEADEINLGFDNQI